MDWPQISAYMVEWLNYLRPFIEIAVIAFIIYKILYFLRGTRGSFILAGIFISLILISLISLYLHFEVLSWLISGLWSVLAVMLVIIFQPELRRAFAQLGSYSFGQRTRKKELLGELSIAVINLAEKKTGALIVVERRIGMRSLIEDSIKLDAKVNSWIIESIFYPKSPLHDGAIIIRDDRIVAARVILPLSRDESISRRLGTRHRAVLGITEESDAVAIAVSEETGQISVAQKGFLRRNIPPHLFQEYLTKILVENWDEEELAIFLLLDGESRLGSGQEKKEEETAEEGKEK